MQLNISLKIRAFCNSCNDFEILSSFNKFKRNEFGTKLIVLPNPNYGDWESNGIFGGRNLNDFEKDSVRRAKINTY